MKPAPQNLPTSESKGRAGKSLPAQLRRSKTEWFRENERFRYKFCSGRGRRILCRGSRFVVDLDPFTAEAPIGGRFAN
jgi:hypothetical protein